MGIIRKTVEKCLKLTYSIAISYKGPYKNSQDSLHIFEFTNNCLLIIVHKGASVKNKTLMIIILKLVFLRKFSS